VTVWFVSAGQDGVYVQHVNPRPAQWYRNLLADPHVRVDFGDGARPGVAEAIRDPAVVRTVLRQVRRKYPAAWLFWLLGWTKNAVAARITLEEI
jgi:hypothetical protein